MTLFELLVKLGIDTSEYKSGLEGAADQLDKWGGRLTSAGTTLTAGVTAPIVALGGLSLSGFKGFEGEINRASALGEIYGADLDKLRELALKLGADTVFSAKEAAAGMAELGAAGFKTNDIIAAMPATLDLAAAGQLKVGEAAEITAGIMGGFGIPAEGVAHAVDVIASAAAAGALSVQDLGVTFRYAGPVAKAAGISFEELAAAATLLSNAGIKADQAGTGLRAGLLRLVKPPQQAADAMERLGVQVKNAQGNLLPIAQIIDNLKTSGAQLEDLAAIFGTEAATTWVNLMEIGGQKINAMAAGFENVDGAVKKMAATLMQGMGGSFEQLSGSVDTFLITLGKALAPFATMVANFLKELADFATEAAKWFGELPVPVQGVAIAFAALAAAVGPALLVLGGMASGAASLMNLFVPIANGATTAATAVTLLKNAAVLLGQAAIVGATAWAAWNIGEWAYNNSAAVRKFGDELANALSHDLTKLGFNFGSEASLPIAAGNIQKLEALAAKQGLAFENLKRQYQTGAISIEQYNQKLNLLIRSKLGANTETTKLAASQQKLGGAATAGAEAIKAQLDALLKQGPAAAAAGAEIDKQVFGLLRHQDLLAKDAKLRSMAAAADQERAKALQEIVRWQMIEAGALREFEALMQRGAEGMPGIGGNLAETFQLPKGLPTVDSIMGEEWKQAMTKDAKAGIDAVKVMWDDVDRRIERTFDNMVDGIVDSIVHWKGFGATVTSIWGEIKTAGLSMLTQTLLDPLKDSIKNIFLGENGLLGGLKNGLSGLFGGILGGKNGKGGLLGGLSSSLGGLLGGLFGGGKGGGGGSGVASSITGAAVSTGIRAGLAGLTGGMSEMFAGMFGGGGGGGQSGIPGGSLLGFAMEKLMPSREEKTLNAIEHEVRYSQIHLLTLVDKANEFWPWLAELNNRWLEYFGYFGGLMTTVEEMRDIMRETRSVAQASGPVGTGPTNPVQIIVLDQEGLDRLMGIIASRLEAA